MITLYNVDCIELLKSLDNNSIDLVITDPPYLIDYKTNHRIDKKHKFCSTIKNDNNPDLISNVIKELYRVMKDNTAGYMFCSFDKVDFFKTEIEKYFKIKNIIIWVKNNWTAGDLKAQFGKQYEMIILFNKGRCLFNGKRLTDVWNFDRVAGKKQLHQNEKPLDLIKQAIEKHSKEGDLILDCFAGSNTTGLACLQSNRNFIGCEIDKEYYEIALKRIQEHSQQSTLLPLAEKQEGGNGIPPKTKVLGILPKIL